MNKILATVILALAAHTPAWAWGDREQGLVAGIIGTIIMQEITRPQQSQVLTMPPVISHRGTYHPIIVSPTIDPRVYRPEMALPIQLPPVQPQCAIFDQYGRVVGHHWCR